MTPDTPEPRERITPDYAAPVPADAHDDADAEDDDVDLVLDSSERTKRGAAIGLCGRRA